jgi:DNA-3-methyladenine glycosylase II
VKAHRELAASDPVMAALVDRFGELSVEARRSRRPPMDAYGTLLRSVVGQQLSSRAAFTIYGRVLDLFGGKTPTPQQLLDVDPQRLRELELGRLSELSDEEVIAEITAIRGFGVWSAHMFLIFFLERPDVLPTGDLGIRNAVGVAYGLDDVPTPAEVERIGERWRPHRSLASIYLWESLANEPV